MDLLKWKVDGFHMQFPNLEAPSQYHKPAHLHPSQALNLHGCPAH
jgi:hypothetical protein